MKATSPEDERKVAITASIPLGVVRQLDEICHQDRMSRSGLVHKIIMAWIEQRKTKKAR